MHDLDYLWPSGTEAKWNCGHVAGAVCAQCHLLLVRRANELAAENERLRETLAEIEKGQRP